MYLMLSTFTIQHRALELICLRQNEDLRRRIVSQLSEKAEGTFLWVALVFQQLSALQLGLGAPSNDGDNALVDWCLYTTG